MAYYELNKHKKSDKIKWIVTGIALVLLFITVTGLCLQLFGTGKVKPSEWFKKDETEQITPDNGGETDTSETVARLSIAPFSAAKVLSATSETGYLTMARSSETTGNVVYDNGSISDYVQDLGGGVYKVYDRTCTNVGNGVGAYHFVGVLDGVEGNSFSSSNSGLVHYFLQQGSPNNNYTSLSVIKFSYYDSDKFGFSGDIPLYQIEFVFSGGRVETPVIHVFENVHLCLSEIYEGETIDTIRFMYRTPVSLPSDPVKEGYTFVGWYYDSEFTTPYAGEPIYADTALYAKFEINQYTVTFNSDGGSAVASQTVDWNTAATLSTPTRDKYAFKGWYLPNGTQYTNQPIKENTILTAHWERNVFTVTFETDGGSAVESQEVNLNASVTLPTTTRMGYNFVGWYMADGTKYENQSVTDDLTLTAHWEVQTFTVTFYVDGEVYETMTVDYGTPLVPAASEFNLNVMSVASESGAPSIDEEGSVVVKENCSVEAVKMNTVDQTINTVNQNKWAIIGGVAGGVALIAVVAAICAGVKHKCKR